MNNYPTSLHGSAIRNVYIMPHSRLADQTTIDRTSTKEGRNEEMRGTIAPALQ